jgi:serine/threonine protein kinase
MQPTRGSTLSHYRLEEKIGAGGMGEVWKAIDLTLDRPVAVKILPEAFSTDPHRVARFEREAKVLASLNHPNIAVIHGIHSAEGLHFLAMELVGGEDLSLKLKRGALPVDAAIGIARQIAEALEAAHDSGVVHRDLKPANIQITPDGKAKVLDFGLAKAFETDPSASSASVSLSPTMTAAATLAGVILGTAAYMSPEQARGVQADRRADIWAFGCVLYEMLSGRRPFDGDTVSDTLASVLKSEPDWKALPGSTPAGVRTLLQRCLEKNPKNRLQAIGDARIAIDEALAHPERTDEPPATTRAAGVRTREITAWVAAGGLAVLAIALYVSRPQTAADPHTMVRSAIIPPLHTRIDLSDARSGDLSMSPDGRYVTFSLLTPEGDESLWVRSLDSLEARPLPGTSNSSWPFWSPDSQQIAFFADGKLKRVDLAGSPAVTICETQDGRGGDWSRDGVIIFSPNPNSGIYSVPASGGTPEQVTEIDATGAKETTHRWPRFLPDGRHFLYLAGSHSEGVRSEANGVYLAELGKSGRRRLLLARSNVAYSAGHLLYVRDRVLLAQSFDPSRLELTGEPVPIADGIATENIFFRTVFAASANGDLVFRSGSAATGTLLTWFGRDGKEIDKVGDQGSYKDVVLSPDNKRVAYGLADADSGAADIWILDLARKVRSRLTFGPAGKYAPIWSPDGQRIVYSVSALHDDLYIRNSGGGDEQVLVHSDNDKQATDWSRDGRYLIFDQTDRETGAKWDIWVVPIAETDKPRPFRSTAANERGGRLSPDGRFMLYTSDESGKTEAYVAPFPGPGGKWQVSTGGVLNVAWTQNGKEIVYTRPDLTVTSLMVHASANEFEVDPPRPLFRVPLSQGGDVAQDGQRFIFALRAEDDQELPLTLVTNWPAGLKH